MVSSVPHASEIWIAAFLSSGRMSYLTSESPFDSIGHLICSPHRGSNKSNFPVSKTLSQNTVSYPRLAGNRGKRSNTSRGSLPIFPRIGSFALSKARCSRAPCIRRNDGRYPEGSDACRCCRGLEAMSKLSLLVQVTSLRFGHSPTFTASITRGSASISLDLHSRLILHFALRCCRAFPICSILESPFGFNLERVYGVA